jgi:hypothetical protein
VSWSLAFKQALLRGYSEPRYLLEPVPIPVNALRPFGSLFPRLSSFPTPGYQALIRSEGSSTSGGVLSVRDWTCEPLAFEIGLLAEEAIDLRTLAQRGQAVQLRVGFTADPVDFQVVAVGTVYGLARSPEAGWTLRCRGLEGSLQSRITTQAGQGPLGYGRLSTTTTEAVSNGEASIDLASVTGLPTSGAVQITANSGETYIVTYTGIAALTLTGCTTPALGTTFAATSSGSAVVEVMYDSAHPIEVALKILTSTGTAALNGVFDTLQSDWAYAIPQQFVDLRDSLVFRDYRRPTAGADDLQWVKPDPLDNGQDALAVWLAGAGYYLTQRQGAVTVHGAVEPWAISASGLAITDADVVSVDGYETWDPDSPIEYSQTRALYNDGTTANTSATSALDHIPSLDLAEHTIEGLYTTTPNASAIAAEAVSILKQWDQRVPEWISLTLRTRWWGALSPGDSVGLEISPLLLTSRTGFDFRGKLALVKRCSVDWFGPENVTRIELLVLPADETVPWREP